MPIQVISGTTPANTGQLATVATTNFSIAFVSGSYADTYISSSATASLRSAAVTAFSVDGIKVVFYSGSTPQTNTADTIFINSVPFNTSAANFTATASAVFNASASAANSATAYSSIQGITSAVSASTGLLFSIGTTGSYDNAYNLNTQYTAVSGSTTLTFGGASMFGPAGSGKVTGSWSQLLATANAQVVISGSVLGEAAFTLTTGTTYTPSGSGLIQAVTVVNPQGTVVAS
jgi:uncharacterized protein YfiM (DUF2279 family)